MFLYNLVYLYYRIIFIKLIYLLRPLDSVPYSLWSFGINYILLIEEVEQGETLKIAVAVNLLDSVKGEA